MSQALFGVCGHCLINIWIVNNLISNCMVEAITITRSLIFCIKRKFVVPDCCHRVRVPRLYWFFWFLGFFGGVFHDEFLISCHLIGYSIMKSGFSLSIDTQATELAVIMVKYLEALSFEATDRPRQIPRSGISQKCCCSSAQEFILGSSVGQRPLNSCP